MTVELIDDMSLWDGFVSESPQGTIFSTSQWLEAACAAQGGEPRCLAVMADGRLVAGATCVHIARGPLRKASTPVLTPYGGIVYRPDPGKRHSEAESFNMSCAEALDLYLTSRYHNVFLVHAPGFTDVRPLTWADWKEHVRYSYVMDITDVDSLWGLLERRVRTVIRNAESSLELGGPIDTGSFTELYERIYRDRGTRLPVGSEVVRRFVDNVMKLDKAEMRTVRNEHGDIVSSMILVRDERTVYAWLSGSVPGENSSGAFTLLFWDAVKRYTKECAKLDMVGANIASLAFFKKGFAGSLTPYYVTEYHRSKMTRLLFGAYSKLSWLL